MTTKFDNIHDMTLQQQQSFIVRRERKIPVPRKVWLMYLYSLYSKLSACKAYILRNSEDEPLKSIIKQYNLIDFQCIDKFLCLLVFFLIRWQWKLILKRSCNIFEKWHVYISENNFKIFKYNTSIMKFQDSLILKLLFLKNFIYSLHWKNGISH